LADVQIRCINKQPRESTHEAISYLGDGNVKWTRTQVVNWIEKREHSFYTQVGGRRADIGVRTSPNGNKFVQTYADGQWNNNLLNLLECV
jgi:hypothetical protein